MHNRHPLENCSVVRPILGLAWFLVMALAYTTPAGAQASNPIEDLKRAIKASQQAEMEQAVGELRSFRQMTEGLLLADWTLPDVEEDKAKLVRQSLFNKFLEEVKKAVTSPDEDYRIAVATLLGDFSLETRSGGTTSTAQNLALVENFPSLVKILAQLATKKGETLRVREAAVQALCKVRAEPKLTETTVLELLTGPEAELHRATAQALESLVGTPYTSSRSNFEFHGSGSDLELLDLANFGPLVFRAARVGLRDPDVEVRRCSAVAIDRVATATNANLELGTGANLREAGVPPPLKELEPQKMLPLIQTVPPTLTGLAQVVQSDSSRQVRLAASRALEDIGTMWHWWTGLDMGPAKKKQPVLQESSGETFLVPMAYFEAEPGGAEPSISLALEKAVRALIDNLSDPSLSNRLAAVEALEKIVSPKQHTAGDQPQSGDSDGGGGGVAAHNPQDGSRHSFCALGGRPDVGRNSAVDVEFGRTTGHHRGPGSAPGRCRPEYSPGRSRGPGELRRGSGRCQAGPGLGGGSRRGD